MKSVYSCKSLTNRRNNGYFRIFTVIMNISSYLYLCFFTGVFSVAAVLAGSITDGWRNPVINCGLKPNEDPVKQYPYGDQIGTAAGLEEFCRRMQERFSHSELTTAEADQVYRTLFAAGWLREGSYGMPGPGVTPPKPPTLKDYKGRIAIRKVATDSYEIFYSYTNCGTNFEYMQLTVANGKIMLQERLEGWSGSFPC